MSEIDWAKAEIAIEARARESYRALANKLGKFYYLDLLVALKQYVAEKRKSNKFTFLMNGQKMGFHPFTFLCDAAIRHGSIVPTGKFPQKPDIENLILKYVNFPDKAEIAQSKEEAMEWFVRAAFNQLPSQQTKRFLLGRLFLMYQDIPTEDPLLFKDFLSFRDKAVRHYLRVTFDEYVCSGFAIGTMLNEGDRFQFPLRSEMPGYHQLLNSDSFKIVLASLSRSRESYVEKSQFGPNDKYLNRHESPMLIHHTPIICKDDWYYCGDSWQVLNSVGMIFHRNIALFYESQSKDAKKEFLGSYGHVFKRYVGKLLAECCEAMHLFDLDDLSLGEQKIADWLLFSDDMILIIECKAVGFVGELKSSGSVYLLNNWLVQRKSAIEQVCSTMDSLKEICKQCGIEPQGRFVQKLIIVEEHFEFVNALEDFLPGSDIVAEIRDKQIQFMSTYEVESIASSNLARQIVRKELWTVDSERLRCSVLTRLSNMYKFAIEDGMLLDKKLSDYMERSIKMIN